MNHGYGKKIFLLTILLFLPFLLFAFEGLSKRAQTADGYNIRLYQIDKNEHPQYYEYYVQLTSNNSEEYFTWCFDNLAEAMEHFNWLKDSKVVYTYTLYGTPITADCRRSWRQYAWEADTSGTYINYWIAKNQRVSYGFQQDWR